MSAVVLSVQGLYKTFGGHVVLRDVAFDLREGEAVLLRGENGSGKTTLLNILSGNVEPDAGQVDLFVNGARKVFSWPRNWWSNLNPFNRFTPDRMARDGVGRVWQDIRLFPTMTVLENVALASPKQIGENPVIALLRPGMVKQEEFRSQEMAEKWLSQLGLGDRLHSSCDKISLGQMKRVAIARAVQAGAKILFLDEPLSGLDGTGVAEVMGYLHSLVRTNRLTVVIVEHILNIPLVLDLTTTVWTLAGGHLSIESRGSALGSERTTVVSPVHDWLTEITGPGGEVESRDLGQGARVTTVTPQGSVEAPTILEVKDLQVRRGYRTIFDGLSLTSKRGQLTLIEAPNGWGKTTLFQVIAGLIPPQRGTVLLRGKVVNHELTHQRVNEGLVYLPTDLTLFPSLTVKEYLALLKIDQWESSFLGGDDVKAKSLSQLSGGELQTLHLLRLNLTRHPAGSIVVLDEPFRGLGPESMRAAVNKVKTAMNTGGILIAQPYRRN